jgi:hypothetical protein
VLSHTHGSAQECGDKRDATVDMLEFSKYEELDLDTNPIVKFPTCQHFYATSFLDELFKLEQFYTCQPAAADAGAEARGSCE